MIWYLSLMQLTAHFDVESLPEADSGAGLDESDGNEKVIIVYCD